METEANDLPGLTLQARTCVLNFKHEWFLNVCDLKDYSRLKSNTHVWIERTGSSISVPEPGPSHLEAAAPPVLVQLTVSTKIILSAASGGCAALSTTDTCNYLEPLQ